MAYCVKCGVELADQAKACPLCQTAVLLPEDWENRDPLTQGFATYPDRQPRVLRHRTNLVPTGSVVMLVTFLLLIPFLVTLFTDLKANGRVTWSFYPMASLILLWLMVAYPALLRRHTLATAFTVDMLATAFFLLSLDLYADGVLNWSWYPAPAIVLVWLCVMLPFWLPRAPILMAAAYFILINAFLWLMEWVTGSGPWFFLFALPLAGAGTLCGLGVWVAFRIIRGRYASAALLTLMLTLTLIAVDMLVLRFLTGRLGLAWSPVTSAVGVPLTALLLAIHLRPDLRTLLQKKFHL